MRLLPFWFAAVVLLQASENEFLQWDVKRANSIVAARRVNGNVGGNLDLRVIRADQSINYKLRATWLTPDAIRACARVEQVKKMLSDEDTLKMVADAESVGDTVILVELDPREGSGVIPSDWIATLSPRSGSSTSPRVVRGTSVPKLREKPCIGGLWAPRLCL